MSFLASPNTTVLARFRPGWLKGLRAAALTIAIATVIAFGTLGYNVGSTYYWLMLTAVVPVTTSAVFRRALIIAQARISARARWMAHGPDVDRVPHTRLERLRQAYADHTRDVAAGFVDDRTWADLGMDEIHAGIDVCFTMAGRNELYRILRHALPQADRVAARASQADVFRDDVGYRERIAGLLAGIGEERDADPASLLWGNEARRDRLYPLFVGMTLLAVVSIVITVAVDVTLGLVLIGGVFLTNMWIYFRKARHISLFVPALRVLSRMINASATLAGTEALRTTTGGARGAFRWLLTGAPSPVPSLSGDIVEMLFLYIKIFFQIDLLAYERIMRHIGANREAYRALYQAIGALDAAFALASYRTRREDTCDAGPVAGDMTEERDVTGARNPCALELAGAYHPLVENAVANSVRLGKPGAIVTGTNMAGKSTFLRTIGINVLFAQTAGFAFATAYHAGRFRVLSSIDKHDDLAEGKSFYYDEAERIFRMIEEADAAIPALLLIDELLSGTNSLERESSSIAILRYLSERNALTVAATHDVTIADSVRDQYALYYFTDSANEKGLTFDYRIQPGVVNTRNAIKLLRLIGYPEDVIRAALDRTEE